jgi:hypothetical protein
MTEVELCIGTGFGFGELPYKVCYFNAKLFYNGESSTDGKVSVGWLSLFFV